MKDVPMQPADESVYAARAIPPTEIVDPDQLIRVEQGLLVIPSGCVMPPICIETNRPVNEQDMIQRELFWCSPWIAGLYVVSGPLLILFYFIAREQCTITYGLDPQIHRRRSLIRSTAAVMAFLLFVITVFLAAANYSAWMFVPAGLLFIIAISVAVANRSPFSVARSRNGMFWIKGFRPEYLAQLPLEA